MSSNFVPLQTAGQLVIPGSWSDNATCITMNQVKLKVGWPCVINIHRNTQMSVTSLLYNRPHIQFELAGGENLACGGPLESLSQVQDTCVSYLRFPLNFIAFTTYKIYSKIQDKVLVTPQTHSLHKQSWSCDHKASKDRRHRKVHPCFLEQACRYTEEITRAIQR